MAADHKVGHCGDLTPWVTEVITYTASTVRQRPAKASKDTTETTAQLWALMDSFPIVAVTSYKRNLLSHGTPQERVCPPAGRAAHEHRGCARNKPCQQGTHTQRNLPGATSVASATPRVCHPTQALLWERWMWVHVPKRGGRFLPANLDFSIGNMIKNAD